MSKRRSPDRGRNRFSCGRCGRVRTVSKRNRWCPACKAAWRETQAARRAAVSASLEKPAELEQRIIALQQRAAAGLPLFPERRE